jgi:hypothetical protein
MKSFKKVLETFVPKFERAVKTDTAYTGRINNKTWVVPHSFHGSGDVLHGAKVTPMRHNIVVSPIHVAHNNPSLTPQEHARIHSHIKDIHGGQEGKVPKFDSMGKLDEDLKADWNRDFSKNRRSNIKRTMRQNLSVKNVGKGNNAWRKADKEDRHPGVVSWPAMNEEEKAPEQKKDNDAATRRELKAARPMRKGAAERFMQRYGKTKIAEEERQQSLHLGMTMADRVQPSKEVPEVKKAETHYKQTHKPVKGTPEYQAERDKYRHPALAASRRAATLAFAKKHHLLEIKNMLNESKPKNGGRVNVFDYHQTQIAKKTLRMPDAMVGVMGGMNKDEARKHLKTQGWDDKKIHKHEHDQFVSEHVWTVTDHLGNKHEVEAKDRSEAMKKTVSVGSKIHPEGIPLTQWNKVKVERKNLEERTLTTGEDAKKEEIVHSMKKKLQGFKERYGDKAKSVMYATATKQAKRLAEELHAYDVHHRGKHIDTIFYGHNEPVEEVKKSLINHDGYHPNITVIKQARKLKEEAEQLDESFMGTYTRNENANRHTANIVHLAKHFGTEADKSEAKFYSDELKKHGHNKHHEAAYKLHEKLWPRAVAAHHMSEEQALVEEKKYTGHFPAQHKVWLAKRDETARGFRRNQDAKRRLAKKQAENPVKEEHSDTYNTIKRVLRGD